MNLAHRQQIEKCTRSKASSMNEEENTTSSTRRTRRRRRGRRRRKMSLTSLLLLSLMSAQLASIVSTGDQVAEAAAAAASISTTTSTAGSSGLRYESESNAYTGLTFTFDPRLDKRVEWLHFDHWLSIMQHMSLMLYEALNGRAHLPEVRVLVPYRWRSHDWSVLHKPGPPKIMNRRLRYADSDVLIGFEEPVYKETPFAVQHDECAKQGLHIHMPISFLEQNQATLDSRLKARLLLREFLSHRYGIFKETGFRSDYMYPIFPSLPGARKFPQHHHHHHHHHQQQQQQQNPLKSPLSAGANSHLALMQNLLEGDNNNNNNNNHTSSREQLVASLRGFDHNWNECFFDTDPSSGLPAPHASTCAPYLTRLPPGNQVNSFNLMGMDPFSYANLSSQLLRFQQQGRPQPLEWRQLNPEQVKWHLCGENFPPPPAAAAPLSSSSFDQTQLPISASASAASAVSSRLVGQQQAQVQVSFAHNSLASNKQNEMCNERSAMDVIKSSEDFKRTQFSPSNFNRLPETNFKFYQEMPPRLVLCVEYAAHLYQAKRHEHEILEAGIRKFLAYDLIADSEMALVLFGLQHSTRTAFKRLDSSVDARLSLYSPAFDPYEEPARLFTEQELLAQLDIQVPQEKPAVSQLPIRGTCSFGRALAEASAALAGRTSYEDVGADLVMITSGLFVEDGKKLEEILRSYPAVRADGSQQLSIIIYPSAMLLDPSQVSGLLEGPDAEQVVRHRVNKLLLIQRISGAKIHLIREQLDSNGNVRMSTLLQFHQVFENIARGHSWEQTDSMMTLSQRQRVELHRLSKTTDASELPASEQSVRFTAHHQNASSSGRRTEEHRLVYKFEVDDSIQEELVVGFVEPKQQSGGGQQSSASSRTGKRFALKHLQLRSPGGHLVLQSEGSPPIPLNDSATSIQPQESLENWLPSTSSLDSLERKGAQDQAASDLADQLGPPDPDQAGTSNAAAELPALFPYRAQLNVAGFHLRRSAHLWPLKSSRRLAGVWTLSAIADEPLQAGALVLARASPAGDTLTGHCWVQTYSSFPSSDQSAGTTGDLNTQPIGLEQSGPSASNSLKAIKVFVRVRAAAQAVAPEVTARLEVEDESGNVVQNNLMLDDGLGSPDMTRADGIYTQFVGRAHHRPGFYRVRVELSAGESGGLSRHAPVREPAALGQDQPCCGSTLGSGANQRRESTKHLARLLYCGTFYAEGLAQQRPARPANLTLVGVDQERRRISLRWFESVGQSESGAATSSSSPHHLDSFSGPPAGVQQNFSQLNDDLNSANEFLSPFPSQTGAEANDDNNSQQHSASSSPEGRALLLSGAHQGVSGVSTESESSQQLIAGRYEIKLFTDRDILRRAFDAKPEVGLRFNKWHVEGPLPNSSSPTGQRDLTLRIPSSKEAIYFVAIRIHQPQTGLSSAVSRPAHFWLKGAAPSGNAQNSDSAWDSNELGASSLDLEDSSEFQQRGGLSQLLPRAGPLDGASLLILVSLMALLISLLCVSLIACLAGSRRSLSSRLASAGKQQQRQKKNRRDGKQVTSSSSAAAIMGLTGSGSSSLNETASNCGGSQQSELASSLSSAGSQCGAQQQQQQQSEVGQALSSKVSLVEELGYQLELGSPAEYPRALHQGNPHHLLDSRRLSQQQQPADSSWLQHTLVNGYAYATVAPSQLQQKQQQQQQQLGDLNQDGLSAMQSWPADVLLSHYDKVKKARERNEAPPVMRVENLEQPRGQFGGLTCDGLGLPPAPVEQHSQQQHLPVSGEPLSDQVTSQQQSYLLRQQERQHPGYFNLQLQQQLSSVLRQRMPSDQQVNERLVDGSPAGSCSPALEGVRELRVSDGNGDQQQQQQQQQHHHQKQLPHSQHYNHPEQPPQYALYCTSNGAKQALAQQTHPMISEPSIYSQVTSLQQVAPVASQQQSYYANHWPTGNHNNSNIYSQAPHYNQYLQQQLNQCDDYHLVGSEQQAANPAISEV